MENDAFGYQVLNYRIYYFVILYWALHITLSKTIEDTYFERFQC